MKKLSLDLAENEAARCLLCFDPPCSQVCPGQLDPAAIIRSIRFANSVGARENLKEKMVGKGFCTKHCLNKNKCEKACLRGRLDKPIRIKSIVNSLISKDSKIFKEGVG